MTTDIPYGRARVATHPHRHASLVVQAIKKAEAEAKAKAEKVQEIKKLNMQITQIKSEMSKFEEQLEEGGRELDLHEQVIHFLLVGGFVYFDADQAIVQNANEAIVQINALSNAPARTNFRLQKRDGFPETAVYDRQLQSRMQRATLDTLTLLEITYLEACVMVKEGRLLEEVALSPPRDGLICNPYTPAQSKHTFPFSHCF